MLTHLLFYYTSSYEALRDLSYSNQVMSVSANTHFCSKDCFYLNEKKTFNLLNIHARYYCLFWKLNSDRNIFV